MRRAFALLLLPMLACSGGDSTTGSTSTASSSASASSGASSSASTMKETAALEVLFDLGTGAVPRFLDVPWPSDLYIEKDGTIVDELPGLDAYIPSNAEKLEATLGVQKGFGVDVGALFRVVVSEADAGAPIDAKVDASSLPSSEAQSLADAAAVMLVDLDAVSAAEARVPARVAFHDDRDAGSTRPPVLSVLPARGVVLAEGHRHAAVVTTRLTASGKHVAASAAFAALRDGKTTSGAAASLYGAAVAQLGKLVPKLATKDIAGLAVFTTMNTSGELASMREQVLAMATPALDWKPADVAPMAAALFADHVVAGYTATFDDWLGTPKTLPGGGEDPARDQSGGAAHGALAAMGTAIFEAPNFLQQRPGGYQDPAHATVARDADGKPIVDPDHPTAKIWVTFALPRGAMPKTGFPVIILQHGLQGDRSFILTLANTFALHGFATVAIEAPTFGARATSPADTVDAKSNFPWSAAAAFNGPDGFVDTQASAVSFFGEFVDFGAVRDQLRETVIDLGTLSDVLVDPKLDLGPLYDAVPGAKFDASKMGYVGDSFGSIAGLMLASVDPRLEHFVLNVGGGGIATEIAANSPQLAPLIGSAASLIYGLGGDRLDETHGLLHLLQAILDPGDPLLHARFIQAAPRDISGTKNRPKSAVLIEAVWDEVVSNEGGEAVARAAGMPLASPNVGSNVGLDFAIAKPSGGGIHDVPMPGITTLLVQASPATHGSDLYDASGLRSFAPPFVPPDGKPPFVPLPMPFPIREPYLGLQSMAVAFFESAFAGKGAPVVKDFPTPRRDFDDDGHDDANDKYPLDPTRW